MSRRRKKSKVIEPEILIEQPPAMRPKRETARVLDLLDRIQAGNVNKEGRTR